MAGRSFIRFKINDPKDDNKDDAASTVSTASSLPFSVGRGRGVSSIPKIPSPPRKCDQVKKPPEEDEAINEKKDDAVNVVTPPTSMSSSSADASKPEANPIVRYPMTAMSQITNFSVGRGRGSFINSLKKSTVSPVTSKTDSTPTSSQTEVKDAGTKSKESSSSGMVQEAPTEVVPQRVTGTIPKASRSQSPGPSTSSAHSERAPVMKHGSKGTPFDAIANSIPIYCDKDAGMFEYEVRFTPEVDAVQFRYKLLSQQIEVIGTVRNFDGVVLYLPKCLPDAVTTLVSKHPSDDSDVNIKIMFKRRRRLDDCIQFYNLLFDKIYRILNYLRIGRQFYDPSSPHVLPSKLLEVWPGYVKAVEELEGGLMLTLDVSSKVLARRTVLEQMTEAYQNSRDRYKDTVSKDLIGKMVLTRYNNKSYRIDDIDFGTKPTDTFECGNEKISFIDYYKKQYNVEIRDRSQCMLVSRKEIRTSGQREKSEMIIYLVPELCFMTGLTDKMRSNFSVLKELAVYTKLSPFQRVGAYKQFLVNIEKTPKAKQVLTDWGLKLESDPVQVKARLLPEERIIFGRKKEFGAGDQCDFTRQATSNELLDIVDFTNWVVIACKTNKTEADAFEKTIMNVCGPTGVRITKPKRFEIPNDRNETYVNEVRRVLKADSEIQIVVVIFPQSRDDRYAAVKRVLCTEIPVPSQCINSRTLKNEAKNRSVVLKIILQMNCKLGGSLWGVKIPLPNTMICGIDTYHQAGHKGVTVAGFTSTYNPEFTQYFSRAILQEKKEELVNGLVSSMESAVNKYRDFNGSNPECVIIYRDGVGNGQLDFVNDYEIPQFKSAFKRISPDYNPKLTFIIVQKRINTKFFRAAPNNPNGVVNAPPGSVLDQKVTNRYMYDFYLISQHVREGSTNPSHYIVLEDEKGFDPDILQRLTYKLTFMYFNWTGTVRVPAPCQYAHKLADLVGMSIKKPVDEKLSDKLFFL